MRRCAGRYVKEPDIFSQLQQSPFSRQICPSTPGCHRRDEPARRASPAAAISLAALLEANNDGRFTGEAMNNVAIEPISRQPYHTSSPRITLRAE